jgi:deoxyhypusine synthase
LWRPAKKNLPIVVPGWEDANIGIQCMGRSFAVDVKNVHTSDATGIELMTLVAGLLHRKTSERCANGKGSISGSSKSAAVLPVISQCGCPMLHPGFSSATGVAPLGIFC